MTRRIALALALGTALAACGVKGPPRPPLPPPPSTDDGKPPVPAEGKDANEKQGGPNPAVSPPASPDLPPAPGGRGAGGVGG